MPAHFAYLQRQLEKHGYDCVGVELPSNANQPESNGQLTGIDEDTIAVRGAVLKLLDTGKNVVVVTHSYGSIPGIAALAGLSVDIRKESGLSQGVEAVVVISGFYLPVGLTMLGIMGGQLPPQYLLENDTTLPFNGPGAISVLYNDLEHNEALKAVWRLKPQSYAVNTSPLPDQAQGIAKIPLHYLMCSKDNAVPFEAQRSSVEAFKSLATDVHAEIIESGHSPFISRPAETANFIRKAAGEDIESGLSAYTGIN